MRKRAVDMTLYAPGKNDKIVLDTNILIKLFAPFGMVKEVEKYTNLLIRIQKSHAELLISSIQLSEFINRCIRFQYEIYRKNNEVGDSFEFKKDYRNTSDYKESMNTILDIVKHDIIPRFSMVDDRFSEMREEDIFTYLFAYDFNDALIVEFANLYEADLVTDDSDFLNYQIKARLVTSNKVLLMRRW